MPFFVRRPELYDGRRVSLDALDIVARWAMAPACSNGIDINGQVAKPGDWILRDESGNLRIVDAASIKRDYRLTHLKIA
jgi:hypothetical protein